MPAAPLTGPEIRRYRKDRNRTQREMADQLGMTRRHLDNLESGKEAAPYILGLAFAALEANLPPWRPPPTPQSQEEILAWVAEQKADQMPAERKTAS